MAIKIHMSKDSSNLKYAQIMREFLFVDIIDTYIQYKCNRVRVQCICSHLDTITY